MNLNFQEALRVLGEDASFVIANSARPPRSYLFSVLLPEVNKADYTISSGNMIVRSTMAGLTSLDSPYPPSGYAEISTFLEESAKIASETSLPERTIRELQTMMQHWVREGGNTVDRVASEALNFLEKVIVQGHLDTMEWLRAQALVTGGIDWTFNNINLLVDYGIPAANLLAARTGNDGYGGSASKFWDDIRLIRSTLRYNLRAIIAHPDTIDMILFNDVNTLQIITQSENMYTLQRLIGSNERPATDTRDTITLMAYDLEAEVFNAAIPGTLTNVPFMPTGKLLGVGNNTRSGYRVGEGSTEDPDQDKALGYTHIAPTVEGGGRPGRWAELYVPERTPMKLNGRGVTNGLPVLEAPEKVCIATTDMV
ncbi:hypothetical protein LCGC14_1283710 [marine sediment metagenome]|uniref:Major capsid protein n=1 Tax=marine sediment metagenome TaxID=412755 RepID=A0A0F9KUG4_9ZZZZ